MTMSELAEILETAAKGVDALLAICPANSGVDRAKWTRVRDGLRNLARSPFILAIIVRFLR